MRHLTLPRFWRHYRRLPREVQELERKRFDLLKVDPYHLCRQGSVCAWPRKWRGAILFPSASSRTARVAYEDGDDGD
jgi:hypothetical protein